MRIVIQAVKDRLEWVEEHIKAQIPYAAICLEQATEYHSNNAYKTFIRSLEMADEFACLHLEDDIEIAEDFLNKVFKEVNERPNDVIQFFSMRKADLEVGSRYEAGRTFMMNQCFYLPKGMSEDLVKYAHKWAKENKEQMHGSPFDIMMADYFKMHKLKYWIVVPNLVNHRQIKSAIDPRRSSKRQSKTFKK